MSESEGGYARKAGNSCCEKGYKGGQIALHGSGRVRARRQTWRAVGEAGDRDWSAFGG